MSGYHWITRVAKPPCHLHGGATRSRWEKRPPDRMVKVAKATRSSGAKAAPDQTP